jgi:hypothetical protein
MRFLVLAAFLLVSAPTLAQLASWNDGAAKSAITDFVKAVCTRAASG